MDTNLEYLKSLGISSPHAVGVMPYHRDASGRIVTDYAKVTQGKIAQDAALSTAKNVGVPAALVTYIDPQVTTILFGAMNATKLFNETKKGDWADSFMQFPVEEVVGDVTPYSDFTNNVTSEVNYEFPTRENFIFQTTLKYGERELATGAKARLEFAGAKQRGAANILARAHNRFYLYGVAGKQNYGALNDPNLPESVTPVSVGGKSTWADKTAANTDQMANIVFNDIAKLINELIKNNAGNVDASCKFRLAVASDRATYLQMPNAFGLTALDLLKSNYPNLEVLYLPELTTEAGSMLYLTVPELFGEVTAECAYSEKMRFGNVEAYSTSWVQKAIGGTWGCVIRRPHLIATMLGI